MGNNRTVVVRNDCNYFCRGVYVKRMATRANAGRVGSVAHTFVRGFVRTKQRKYKQNKQKKRPAPSSWQLAVSRLPCGTATKQINTQMD